MSKSPNVPMPESVRELLWAAAESNDPATIAEFERRYPQYRAELHRTRAMIDAMRQARPQATTMARFRVPESARRPIGPRLALALAAVLGLALVGFSAYQVTGWLHNQRKAPSATQPNSSTPLPPPSTGSTTNSVEPTPTPQATDPAQRGVAERPLPPAPPPAVVRLTGDATLFDAIAALKSAGFQVRLDPDVKDTDLNLAPNNADAIVELSPEEAILLIERQAPVRVQDLGPEGLLIVPLEKVRNVEAPSAPAQPREAIGN
ncbi:MAG: hypothetical protein KatS3mg015_2165 [Fimbriimonadales bacterium]|nr:MAG: hypothetical protein KatS3mg015_2165 [Fimbriimonadales bacterium]